MEPYSGASTTPPPSRAPVGPVAAVERCRHRLGREHAGEVVRDGDPGTHRRAVGIPGQVEQAAVGDAHAVQPGPSRVGAVLPEHTDSGPDEPRVTVVRGPMFHASNVPGRKFSQTTSARATRRRKRAWPFGSSRLSVTPLRPRPSTAHQSE